jgi:hypothetical protein
VLEVGGQPDRWAPPVGERERERRGGGRWWAVGPEEGKRATQEEKKQEVGRGSRWAGGGLGRLDRFCFFLFFFKSISKLFQTLLNSNLLHLFKFKF